MLSKAQIKYIRSLTQQKYRKEHNVFIAEGDKIAREWLRSNREIKHIVALQDWVDENHSLIERHPETVLSVADEKILASVSALQTPHKVLVVIGMPQPETVLPASGWTIALDTIQDPGNMGTIIRIADWFGIPYIVCSPGCVDVYNPKVIQAAMGGHLRVRFFETDIYAFVQATKTPVLAATLNGKSLYEFSTFKDAILLIGNESKGLDDALISWASHQITIPGKGGAESLNAAVSAGIICSHLLGH